MEDRLIIEQLFERSEIAINHLMVKYEKICKSIAFNILTNEEDAKECVNDTYLAVWNTIPPKTPDSLSAYIAKIARNLALKKYRSNTAKKRNHYYDISIDEIADCFGYPDNVHRNLEMEELIESINRFLVDQKKEDRIIFMQRYWFNRDVLTIASSMNKSKNYIQVHLFRIRERLSKYLVKEGLV